MQRKLWKTFSSVLLASVAATALFLSGCEGDDGRDGRDAVLPGPTPVNVTTLTPQQQADLKFEGEVTGVTIASPPVIRFTVTDDNGAPIVGIGQKDANGRLTNLAFSIAKLVPGSNGTPSKWVNYLVTTVATATTPAAATRPTRDREGTLVDNGDGTYQYTFARDITQIQAQVNAFTYAGNNRRADLGDLTYNPNLTHRLVIEYGGEIPDTDPEVIFKNALNVIYDFIPATGARVTAANTQREIVLTKWCNECHGNPGDPTDLTDQGYGLGITTPHDGRVDTRYCTVCHTSQRAYGRAISTATAGAFTGNTYVTNEGGGEVEVLGEFVTLVHKIHMGSELSETGYNYAGVRFNDIVYTQSAALCRKCHRDTTAEQRAQAPQAENWHSMPSRKACGSCHDSVNFVTGAGHSAGNVVQLNDAGCTACHNSTAVKGSHALTFTSTFNPDPTPGFTNFRYEILPGSATVAAGTQNLSFKFRILADNTPVTFVAPAASVTAPLTGFTGSPSFLLAYALPQPENGISTPIDYNNRGMVAGQPEAVSIAFLLSTANAARGNIAARDANGYYTATINSAFPAGASLRAVGIQGSFTQQGVTEHAGRFAVSVIEPVQGDTARRRVVDSAKCARCHERLEFHGGSRVLETQLCVVCHNPNFTSSGRTITDAKLSTFAFTPLQEEILLGWDPAFDQTTPGYALLFPETSNNFKDMIHGIHAGEERTTPFRDVRNGPGAGRITLINAAEIRFPNLMQECEVCHVSAGNNQPTYRANLPDNVLPSTHVIRNATDPETIASVTAARNTVPNLEDLVVAPTTAACISCHDTAAAKAHMQANGAQLGAGLNGPTYTNLGVARSTLNEIEQCALCHGPGRIADVVVVHER